MNKETFKEIMVCPCCGKIICKKDIEEKIDDIPMLKNKMGNFIVGYSCKCGNNLMFKYKRGFWKWLKIKIKRFLGLA